MRFHLSLLVGMFTSVVMAAEKPNIVLIFADDLGWKDVGYQGTGIRAVLPNHK